LVDNKLEGLELDPACFPELEVVDLRMNRLTGVGVSKLATLRALYLGCNPLEVGGLGCLPAGLQFLDLSDTDVADVDGLRRLLEPLKSIERIWIARTPLSLLSSALQILVYHLPSLKFIDELSPEQIREALFPKKVEEVEAGDEGGEENGEEAGDDNAEKAEDKDKSKVETADNAEAGVEETPADGEEVVEENSAEPKEPSPEPLPELIENTVQIQLIGASDCNVPPPEESETHESSRTFSLELAYVKPDFDPNQKLCTEPFEEADGDIELAGESLSATYAVDASPGIRDWLCFQGIRARLVKKELTWAKEDPETKSESVAVVGEGLVDTRSHFSAPRLTCYDAGEEFQLPIWPVTEDYDPDETIIPDPPAMAAEEANPWADPVTPPPEPEPEPEEEVEEEPVKEDKKSKKKGDKGGKGDKKGKKNAEPEEDTGPKPMINLRLKIEIGPPKPEPVEEEEEEPDAKAKDKKGKKGKK